MNKVINFMDKQKKEYDVYLYKYEFENFRDGYLKSGHDFFKAKLKKCGTSDEIFGIFMMMVNQGAIPLICSVPECKKAQGIEKVKNKSFRVTIFLKDDPMQPSGFDELNKESSMLYLKILEEDMFQFKEGFLAHDVKTTIESLKDAEDEIEIINVVNELMIFGVIPILWPLVSEFDTLADIPVNLYLIDEEEETRKSLSSKNKDEER